MCVRGRQIDRKGCELQVVELESHRQNIVMDSLSVGMCKSSMRYTGMIAEKIVEEQSLQNTMILRCTGDSMHTRVQMHG